MSVLPPFDHQRPASLNEALGLVSWDDAPYAGGTELLLAMRGGLLRPRSLVDLKRVDELSRIGRSADAVNIGGSVTHRSAIGDPIVRELCPVLPEVLTRVGNPRVRAAGTLGGNLCFAEPKSDVATILIALDAMVILRSSSGSRTLSVSEFVLGPYTTARGDDEILVEITVPSHEAGAVVYEKFQTMERPTVGVAVARRPDGRTRVVVGAVGGAPEVYEDRGSPDPDAIAAAVEVIPDLTGGERYKRHVTAVAIRRALTRLESAA